MRRIIAIGGLIASGKDTAAGLIEEWLRKNYDLQANYGTSLALLSFASKPKELISSRSEERRVGKECA